MTSVTGLCKHYLVVHQVELKEIPNALPERSSVNVEVYGMAGVPRAAMRARLMKKADPQTRAMLEMGIDPPKPRAPTGENRIKNLLDWNPYLDRE